MSTIKISEGEFDIQVSHEGGHLQIVVLKDQKAAATVAIKNGVPTFHVFDGGNAIASLALVDGKPLLFDEDCKQVWPVPMSLAADHSHLLN